MSTELEEKTIIEVPPSNVRNRQNSTGDDGPRFDQSRKEWATSLDAQATAYLQDHFGVSEHAILDLEGSFDGEYDTGDLGRLFQWMDYAGVDKIIDDCGQRFIPVANRFRPANDSYDVDFSFRVENGIPNKGTEWEKCHNGKENGGLYPTIYAFGVVDESGDEPAFESFHLIDVDDFLDAIDAGELAGSGPYKSDGGTKALYYSVDDLREAGCLIDSWGEST